MKTTVTVQDLITAGMPKWDVNKFVNLFPGGEAEVSKTTIKVAGDAGLSVRTFLSAIASRDVYNYADFYRAADWDAETELKKQHEEQLRLLKEQRVKSEEDRMVEALLAAINGFDTVKAYREAVKKGDS